jgi:hypothetical protein
MNSLDPKAVVVDALSQTRVTRGGVAASNADPLTVVFRKQRDAITERLFALSYVTRQGESRRALVNVVMTDQGDWAVATMVVGGSSGPEARLLGLDVIGWGWPNAFRGGAWLIGSALDTAHLVQLRFVNGAEFQDTVDSGVALFIGTEVATPPAIVTTIDANGVTINERTAFTSEILRKRT